MKQDQALAAFSALSQSTRLQVFRLLAKADQWGMTAGALAEALGAPPSTLSHHLAILEKSGLVLVRKEGRNMRYAVRPEEVAGLLRYLLEDCCGGDQALCGLSTDEPLLPSALISSSPSEGKGPLS